MNAVARLGAALMGIGGILLVVEAIVMFADAGPAWLQGLTYGVLGIGLSLWAIGVLTAPSTESTQ